MAPLNAHLLVPFQASASEETYNLAKVFLQKTQTTMKELVGSRSAGSPAVCILLASERLGNKDFDRKAAQKQSSLSPQDFNKLYKAVKTALEEEERSSIITYDALYDTYSSIKIWKKEFHQFILEIENALIEVGETPDTTLFRCTAFFILWSVVAPKQIPTTTNYAVKHGISLKLMDNAIKKTRSSKPEVERQIKLHSKQVQERERANLDGASRTATPRTVNKTQGVQTPQKQPIASSSALASPTRTQPQRHATRVAQLPSPTRHIWKATPLRALPSRDSPQKRAQEDTPMDVDEEPSTPSKRRRTEVESLPEPATTPSRPLRTPAKKNPQIFPPSALRSASTKKPAKVVVANPLQMLAPVDNVPEERKVRRRFRPVYLEHKQWCARDPSLKDATAL